MERNCKNCGSLVYAGKAYCADCGAKWIEKRITLRNVGQDFADMYLGYDTKFVRTFIDLFKKPEEVIKGFINGRRMGYVDAIRYLFVSLFVTGIVFFILKQMDLDVLKIMDVESIYKDLGYSAERIQRELAMQRRIQEVQSKYMSFIIFASIPVMALIGRITFWGKKYFNFTEHIVFYMYTYSHITIASSIVSIVLLLASPSYFTYWGSVAYIIMPLYMAFAYKRCFKLNWQEAILKMFVAILLSLFVFVLIVILGIIIGVVGVIIYSKFIDPSWDPTTIFPPPSS